MSERSPNPTLNLPNHFLGFIGIRTLAGEWFTYQNDVELQNTCESEPKNLNIVGSIGGHLGGYP
jgi:hypothetical protein